MFENNKILVKGGSCAIESSVIDYVRAAMSNLLPISPNYLSLNVRHIFDIYRRNYFDTELKLKNVFFYSSRSQICVEILKTLVERARNNFFSDKIIKQKGAVIVVANNNVI